MTRSGMVRCCPAFLTAPPPLVQTWTRLREMAADRRVSDQNGRVGSWDARQSSSNCRRNNHRSAAAGASDSDPHVSPPTHHGRATIATRRTGLGVGRQCIICPEHARPSRSSW